MLRLHRLLAKFKHLICSIIIFEDYYLQYDVCYFYRKKKFVQKEDIIDYGGGYRDTLTSISEELVETGENPKVKCLKKCANSDSYRLNESATDEQDREFFVMLGALLAFAFLSGQCFGI